VASFRLCDDPPLITGRSTYDTATAPGRPLTPSQREALREYARHADHQAAATCRGVVLHTQKNQASAAMERMGAMNAIHALRLLGWLQVPNDR
jgi:hypothetical protein